MEKSSCCLALCWFFNPILKNGSYSDLPLSIKPDNIFPMLSAGIKNIPLTKYLIQQVRQSPKDRIDALKEYVPSAKSKLDN
jgi:malate dehydrogenase (quinone)